MASESVLGGSSDSLRLDTESTNFLDSLLAGATQASVVTLTGGSQLIQGSNPTTHESNVILFGNNSTIPTPITDGNVVIQVTLPAGVDLGFRGTDTAVSSAGASAYLHGLLEAAAPLNSQDPAITAYRANLANGINNIVHALEQSGTPNTSVRVVVVNDSNVTPGVISLDMSQSPIQNLFDHRSEAFVLLMGNTPR